MQRLQRIGITSGSLFVVLFVIGVLSPLAITQQAIAQQAPTQQGESAGAEKENTDSTKNPSDKPEKTPWINLADHWEECEFGGDGEITIKDGVIKLEFGQPLTGVRWNGPFEGDQPTDENKAQNDGKSEPLPRDNYEIRWECRRDRGHDFPCAFTFPIADSYASLVMGGWGGGITGLSSIDGQDASDNNTTMFKHYDDGKWYSARVRVETEKITVWIDGVEMFDHERKNHQFGIRFEMDPCTPMGIANFECDSQIRNIQLRRLHPSEIAPPEKDDE